MQNNWNIINDRNTQFVTSQETKTFMSQVFSWMFLALIISSITAYFFAANESLSATLRHETGALTIMGYVVMFAPLAFVFAIGLGINRFSYSVLVILFLCYSVLMGASLSSILLVYTTSSIIKTFTICALMYGVMAVMGYTTKTDLTQMGTFLRMALIGLIIATLINFFTQSEKFDYIISFIGVVIFTGLTAYDVQKLKEIGSGNMYEGEQKNKLSILGALNLYLDFVNLFLYLLRFFGDRK
jgi:uncharacterized protein